MSSPDSDAFSLPRNMNSSASILSEIAELARLRHRAKTKREDKSGSIFSSTRSPDIDSPHSMTSPGTPVSLSGIEHGLYSSNSLFSSSALHSPRPASVAFDQHPASDMITGLGVHFSDTEPSRSFPKMSIAQQSIAQQSIVQQSIAQQPAPVSAATSAATSPAADPLSAPPLKLRRYDSRRDLSQDFSQELSPDLPAGFASSHPLPHPEKNIEPKIELHIDTSVGSVVAKSEITSIVDSQSRPQSILSPEDLADRAVPTDQRRGSGDSVSSSNSSASSKSVKSPSGSISARSDVKTSPTSTDTRRDPRNDVTLTEVDRMMLLVQAKEEARKPHPDVQSGEVTFRCTVEGCGKFFKQRAHLHTHMRSHNGERPYVCPFKECNKYFSQRCNLHTHIRSHTGERPYKCNVCGRAFSQQGNMRHHQLIHYNEHPLICKLDHCNKSFNQLGNLKAHHNAAHKKLVTSFAERLASGACLEDLPQEEREMFHYFCDLYKNSNRGIKGRGKGTKTIAVHQSVKQQQQHQHQQHQHQQQQTQYRTNPGRASHNASAASMNTSQNVPLSQRSGNHQLMGQHPSMHPHHGSMAPVMQGHPDQQHMSQQAGQDQHQFASAQTQSGDMPHYPMNAYNSSQVASGNQPQVGVYMSSNQPLDGSIMNNYSSVSRPVNQDSLVSSSQMQYVQANPVHGMMPPQSNFMPLSMPLMNNSQSNQQQQQHNQSSLPIQTQNQPHQTSSMSYYPYVGQ